jgi:hypothetical protein
MEGEPHSHIIPGLHGDLRSSKLWGQDNKFLGGCASGLNFEIPERYLCQGT